MAGKLYYYYGSMNSQKSAQLIMTHHNFEQQGKKTIVFKSALDTRDNTIKSRALSKELEATLVIRPTDNQSMYDLTKLYWAIEDVEFVFVDEVQFLTPSQIEELSDIVDEFNIDVICYGLLTDFQGKLFPGSHRLIEEADSIREIKNQCAHCKRKATRNMRLLDGEPVFEGEVIQVGAEETYRAICRKCYKEFKAKATVAQR
jgi:thymidine kinase